MKQLDERNYMIYKGEDCVFIGTPTECCKFLGIKRQSFWSKVCRVKNGYYNKPRYWLEVIEDE